MKKRRLTVCILLCLALTTGALAANPSAMTDIRGHWARDAIYYGMTEGLFNGVTDTEFAPNQSMTRGMFVTVLGRLAEIDPELYEPWFLEKLYDDVSPEAWYAPYVCWATQYGVANGFEGGLFLPDEPITREQMATMVVRFASIYNYELVGSAQSANGGFADADDISDYARTAVENLRLTGVMTGSLTDNGTYVFIPRQNATRGEGAALVSRLSRSMRPYADRKVVEVESLSLAPVSAELRVGDTSVLTASVRPTDATNQTITWFSTDSSVVRVRSGGILDAVAEGTAEVCAVTYNGLIQSCEVTVTSTPDLSLAYAGESYAEKCYRVFGELPAGGDYKGYYVGKGDGHTVSITVPVWQFTDSSHTEKQTSYITLQVHKNMAATFQAIFEEIYNGPEKFPIYNAGCYRANEHSEHGLGLAVDINWDENYECYNDGTPMTGSYWKPGEDPYSIPADGDVVRAFKKYGFGWGGEWNSKKDYMHFSYFAT